MTSKLSILCPLRKQVQICGVYCNLCGGGGFSRSDSDSEGENPEKKKLQEQLMGK